ncbi:GTP pyrophosphokinase family protein [Lysinibacillus xylanilyticus]|uniref:GTP pyrophosphokinase n=1 Tax=Lysinibacillus xylanilyticus TaxID=582475 RepID=UPI002B23F4E4|nr:GTP pyrophosphokinase family protein [Lysinibacillus xylanilyticus]MEB2279164.1 GTP pyrophosphokinase family protein [Lysinibacillus xylanilyticus]
MKNELEATTLQTLQTELTRFFLVYKFALQEIETKITILQEEFKLIHEYNPIEHLSTRIKSPKSILLKVKKKNLEPSIEAIREDIRDIAGVRITCSFVEDIYKVSAMLQAQNDIEVVDVKDYIAYPKGNGYQSLHLIIKIPIFMSDRMEKVYVEIQIRTIAMDFWASLEHKIYYKYNKEVPEHIRFELKEAAIQVAELDRKMERLNKEINILKANETESSILETTPIAHLAQYIYQLPFDNLSEVDEDDEN